MDKEKVVSVKKLSFSYKNTLVLENCSLELYKNKIYTLLGENGVGKTTFLNLLTNNIMNYSGNINIATSKISYMTDEFFYYPYMNLQDMSNIVGILGDIETDKLKNNVDKYVEKLNLTPYKSINISELSLGTKKRIHLLLTLITDPDFIIMDEPTNGLDPMQVFSLIETITELKSEGKMFFISTHSISLAKEISDDIFILKDKNIIKATNIDKVEDNFKKTIT